MSQKSAGKPHGNRTEIDQGETGEKVLSRASELRQHCAAELKELREADPFAISTVQRALGYWHAHLNRLNLVIDASKENCHTLTDDGSYKLTDEQRKWRTLAFASALRSVEDLGRTSAAILHEFARTNNLDTSVFAIGAETVLNESQRYDVVVRVRLAIKSLSNGKRGKITHKKRTLNDERNDWIRAQPASMSNEDVARQLKVRIARGCDWKPVKHEMVRQIRANNAKDSKASQN